MIEMLKDLLLQVVMITTCVFTYQIFLAGKLENSKYARTLHAALFGGAILVSMSMPHVSHAITSRTIIPTDIRIVPLLLGTLYGGWGAGLFLSAVIVLYRLHFGLDSGFYTSVLALLFSMPVIVACQKRFVKADRKGRIRIALLLSVYYTLAGLTSEYFVGKSPFPALQAALVFMIVTLVFVFFFVALNEMIRETLTRNRQLQTEVEETEFAFLRSQIKPHFLNNALNSIAALCLDEPQRAEHLILDLSRVLKSGFDFKQLETLTTLESELELVEAYLNIEKARFGDRLSIEYDVDVKLDIWMPSLVLQPLVENAVRHGLMRNLQGGTVKISIQEAADAAVHFVVEDNGCGMSPEKREEILHPHPEQKGVGLRNISERIRRHYGKTIRIESTEGIGTRVCFEIPI